MDDVSGHRNLARFRWARQAATVTAACVLVSCGTDQKAPDAQTKPDRTASGSTMGPREVTASTPSPATRPEPDEAARDLRTVPARIDPVALAGQLDRASATLRDRDATDSAVRHAAEFQQLAVHTLATASSTFRRKVTARLQPETALVTRADVTAARLIDVLNGTQEKLPHWRIVVPPPAGELGGYYRAAQRRTDVPWTYLAAIHLVETRMGRVRGTSTAGAQGPMQFMPSTWQLYGAGGDINDPRDAILAAARLLKANGAPDDMTQALWHYNPSDYYVRAVSEYARTMQRSGSAYRAYYHWRVLFRHTRGTYLLPLGYPNRRPVLLPGG